ncbi:hypothetical protein GCM10025868_09210 [Angustibacter aerolatus]|uniref:Uncharacterized protein n=1 Tax=Angustibacter aerolatus TaxID=1162965 RepID=A0ABQ6JFW4_9ACTN|nr:hypothetical protein [Angustibacter aerolatus]GMA85671.1 hypothetical protein GCM10025868_09210 [Angustibacter aerolatus]
MATDTVSAPARGRLVVVARLGAASLLLAGLAALAAVEPGGWVLLDRLLVAPRWYAAAAGAAALAACWTASAGHRGQQAVRVLVGLAAGGLALALAFDLLLGQYGSRGDEVASVRAPGEGSRCGSGRGTSASTPSGGCAPRRRTASGRGTPGA